MVAGALALCLGGFLAVLVDLWHRSVAPREIDRLIHRYPDGITFTEIETYFRGRSLGMWALDSLVERQRVVTDWVTYPRGGALTKRYRPYVEGMEPLLGSEELPQDA